MRAVTSYEQAVEFLLGRINYERAPAGSYSVGDFKLERVKRLLGLLDDPQDRIPAVHIAGTKGKGSTAAMIAEMLDAAGYRVGLFTSPHISAFEERMTAGGVRPEPQTLVELVNRLVDPIARLDQTAGMSPTFFEVTTAMAWLYFAERQTQLAVLEVGLGGRLDATNVCRPEVAVITNISRDHTSLLGSTLARIAGEKAGIVKPGIPVVSGVMNERPRRVVASVCRDKQAMLFQLGREVRHVYRTACEPGQFADVLRHAFSGYVGIETPWRQWADVPLPLAGAHQAANAALATAAVDVLSQRGWNIPHAAVHAGMARVQCPLRIEVLCERPTVVVDAAHNGASMAALLATLKQTFSPRRRLLVFAATRDKDIAALLRLAMPEFDTVVLTQYQSNPRAMPVEQLQRIARKIAGRRLHIAPNPTVAWKLAGRHADVDDLICVAGSFFLAAEMRQLILDQLGRSCADRSEQTDQPQQLAL